MDEDPAATPAEQEEAPDRLAEQQEQSGPGHADDTLPGDDPPAEPIHES